MNEQQKMERISAIIREWEDRTGIKRYAILTRLHLMGHEDINQDKYYNWFIKLTPKPNAPPEKTRAVIKVFAEVTKGFPNDKRCKAIEAIELADLSGLTRAENHSLRNYFPKKEFDKAWEEYFGLVPKIEVCPYPGLRAFKPDDSNYFFGRETLIENLLKQLSDSLLQVNQEARLLIITGPSGSGKSSLAQAGLVAGLRDNKIEGSSDWPVIIFQPGVDPLVRLSTVLHRKDFISQDQKNGLKGEILRQNHALHEVTYQSDSRHHIVLLVDQFEEMFTLCDSDQVRTAFIENLLYAASVSGGHVVILLTLRADFLGQCTEYGLAQVLSTNQVLIGPLTADELRLAITEPAHRAGYTLEPGLVDLLLIDVRNQSGVLPLLQYTLQQLCRESENKQLTEVAYKEIGGVTGALEKWAEDIYKALTAEGQKVLKEIFLQLIQLSEDRTVIKRRVTLKQLGHTLNDHPDFDSLINTLADNRLVTLEGDEAEQSIELAHEALIRGWKRLRVWIENDWEWLHTRRRLSDDAEQWMKNNFDPDFLWPIGPVERALTLKDKMDQFLDEYEKKYLDASQKKHEDETLEQLRVHEEKTREIAKRKEKEKWVKWLTMVSILAVLFAIIASIQWGVTAGLRLDAEANRLSEVASRQLDSHNPSLALLLALESRNIKDTLTNESLIRSSLLSLWSESRTLTGHEAEIWQAEWSGDGTKVVTASSDGTARIWNVRNGQQVAALEYKEPVLQAKWRQDDRIVAAAGVNGSIIIWDTDARKQFIMQGHTATVWHIAWGQDARLLSASSDNTVRVWDVESGETLVLLKGHTAPVVYAAWSPDGKKIATASEDKTARIWDADTGELLGDPLDRHTFKLSQVAWSGDGSQLLTASWDGSVRVWDAETGIEQVIFTEHKSGVSSAVWSPDDTTIVSTSEDGTARVWNVQTGIELKVLKGHKSGVRQAIWSEDGRQILTAGDDGTARVWDVGTGQEFGVLVGHDDAITHASWNSDFTQILTTSEDGTARLWDTKSLAEDIIFPKVHSDEIEYLAWNDDRDWLVTTSKDNTALIRDGVSGEIITRLVGHDFWVRQAAWDSSGNRLVTASEDGTTRVWDVNSGKELIVLGELEPEVSNSGVTLATWNRAGTQILSASRDGTAKVWDVMTGNKKLELPHGAEVWQARWDQDESSILTAGNDGMVKVWDANSGQLEAEIQGHIGPIWRAVWSQNGEQILTAGDDRTAKIWDIDSQRVLELSGHIGPVFSATWNQKETRILTASQDGTAKVWDAENGQQILELNGHDGSVVSATWNQKETEILTTGSDGTVRVWDVNSGFELALLKMPAQEITFAAWGDEDRQIAVASKGGTVRIIQHVPSNDLFDFACQRIPRKMTNEEWQRFMQDESYGPTC